MAYHRVHGEPHLVRDTKSKAILNVNAEALTAYRKQREQRKKLKEMMESHERIKAELDDVKAILHTILEKIESK